MPQRHGLYQSVPIGLLPGTRITPEQLAGFRCGITCVFENLRIGPFLTNPADKSRVTGLKSHFDEITRRFVFSLQHLNDLMLQMVAEFERSHVSMFLPKIIFEAGCQADHILTYLNSMLDDVAHCIMFSTGFVSPAKRPIDSMGGLKHKDIRSNPALYPVFSLLAELDDSNSWWEIGFKTGVGARQLLIHNQHVVTFQGSQSPGGPMEANAVLRAPFGQTPVAFDFFVVLRELFTKLCDWLDRLEAALTAHLPIVPPPAWWPKGFCPRILLPLGCPMTGVQFSEQYFPLPLCDGSDALPWEFAPPSFEI